MPNLDDVESAARLAESLEVTAEMADAAAEDEAPAGAVDGVQTLAVDSDGKVKSDTAAGLADEKVPAAGSGPDGEEKKPLAPELDAGASGAEDGDGR